MNPSILDRILQRVITYSFYLLYFFVPFLFYTGNSELFEFIKMVATYLLTTLIAGAWTSRSIISGKIIFQKTMLDIPLLLFLLSQIISTIFSIDRHTSIWGYYSRSNGGLLSILCYLILYWAYVSNIEKDDLKIHIKGLLYCAMLISIWAIFEHFGYSISCLLLKGEFDTNCWIQDVQNRVFATLGQPNWLAAWIVAIIPLTWVNTRILTHIPNTVCSTLLFSALLFTKSRSGFLAYVAAFGVFWFFNLYRHKNLKLFASFALPVLLLSLIFGTPWSNNYGEDFIREFKSKTPKAGSLQLRDGNSGTVIEQGGTESFSIRQIVWKGAVDIWRAYPVFGSGVETFAYSYYQYRDTKHNQTSEWDFLYNKAHNEYLNYLSTTGIFGVVNYLLLIGTFLYWCIRNQKTVSLVYLAGYVSLLISNSVGFSVVATATLFYLLPAFAIVENGGGKTEDVQKRFTTRRSLSLAIMFIIFIYILFKIINIWRADTYFTEGERLIKRGSPHLAIDSLGTAIELRNDEPIYYNKYASSIAEVAVTLFEENEATRAGEIANDADKLLSRALSVSPRNVQIIKESFSDYSNLSAVDSKYLQKAHNLAEYLAEIAPTDPKALHILGLSQARIGQETEAVKSLERARDFRPDFIEPRYVLATLYDKRNEKEMAKAEMRYILENVDANDERAKSLLGEF